MGRRMAELVLSDAERTELKLLSSRRKTAQALAMRARIVLECARGLENQEVAASLRVAKGTVGKWRRRFVERRMDGLHETPPTGLSVSFRFRKRKLFDAARANSRSCRQPSRS
jgi:hypothetical protein